MTGSAPGRPRQTGQTCVFGGAPVVGGGAAAEHLRRGLELAVDLDADDRLVAVEHGGDPLGRRGHRWTTSIPWMAIPADARNSPYIATVSHASEMATLRAALRTRDPAVDRARRVDQRARRVALADQRQQRRPRRDVAPPRGVRRGGESGHQGNALEHGRSFAQGIGRAGDGGCLERSARRGRGRRQARRAAWPPGVHSGGRTAGSLSQRASRRPPVPKPVVGSPGVPFEDANRRTERRACTRQAWARRRPIEDPRSSCARVADRRDQGARTRESALLTRGSSVRFISVRALSWRTV